MNTIQYTYDNLGRLTTITYTSNSTTIVISYDTAGNRTSVNVTCPGGTC